MSEIVELSMAGSLAKLRRRVAALERLERYVGAYGCAFLAYNSATDTDVTGDGTVAKVDFDTEVFDLGGDFAGDTFTARITGQHLLIASVSLDDLAAAHTNGRLELVTSNRTYLGSYGNWGAMRNSGDRLNVMVAALADMDAADTAYVNMTVYNGGKDVDVLGNATTLYTFFCGCCVHRD